MTALKLFSYLYCQRTTRYPKDQKDPDPEKPKIQTSEKPGNIRKTKNEDPTLRKATKKTNPVIQKNQNPNHPMKSNPIEEKPNIKIFAFMKI